MELQGLGRSDLVRRLRGRLGRARDRVITSSLVGRLTGRDTLPEPELLAWAKELHAAGQRLVAGTDDPREWQGSIDRLYASAPMEALCRRCDVDRVLASSGGSERGERFVFAPLLPRRLGGQRMEGRRTVITKLAVVRNGAAVPPHAHENMVSAFLTLRGTLRVRQAEKIADRGDHLIIGPIRDEVHGPGDWSSVSDLGSNIHWLEAVGGDAAFFSTKVVGVDPRRPLRGRICLDMTAAVRNDDGTSTVPVVPEGLAHQVVR